MLHGLELLSRDADTKAIVLISKPPSPAIAREVIAAARKAGKPVVINFIGSTEDPRAATCMSRARDEAASAAVCAADGRKPPRASILRRSRQAEVHARTALYPRALQRRHLLLRGLGNSRRRLVERPVDSKRAIPDPWKSREHTLIDLGDDVFTRGRPHPMIDLRLRNDRLLEEAADPQVAVILLDVVLGYGSHPDPAAEIVPVLMKIKKKSRSPVIVASVCGTDEDPQGLERQESALRAAGVCSRRAMPAPLSSRARSLRSNARKHRNQGRTTFSVAGR